MHWFEGEGTVFPLTHEGDSVKPRASCLEKGTSWWRCSPPHPHNAQREYLGAALVDKLLLRWLAMAAQRDAVHRRRKKFHEKQKGYPSMIYLY